MPKWAVIRSTPPEWVNVVDMLEVEHSEGVESGLEVVTTYQTALNDPVLSAMHDEVAR